MLMQVKTFAGARWGGINHEPIPSAPPAIHPVHLTLGKGDSWGCKGSLSRSVAAISSSVAFEGPLAPILVFHHLQSCNLL